MNPPVRGGPDRKWLLFGTALASTLLLATSIPASAVTTCVGDVGTASPINHTVNDTIICVNTEPRTSAGTAINLVTSGTDHDIYLNSSGALTAGFYGVRTYTSGADSGITIINTGDVLVSSVARHIGIFAKTASSYSPVVINNSGNLRVTTSVDNAYGIYGRTDAGSSSIGIINSGNIRANSIPGDASGLFAQTNANNVYLHIINTGDLNVTAGRNAFGISAQAGGNKSRISVANSGDIAATSNGQAYAAGIFAASPDGTVSIESSGHIAVSARKQAMGLVGQGQNTSISIVNSGDIDSTAGSNVALGIMGQTYGGTGPVAIDNSGDIFVQSQGPYAGGIVGITGGPNSSVSIANSGDLNASRASMTAAGIFTQTYGDNSGITIQNGGDIWATKALGSAYGISAQAQGANSPVNINNSGELMASSGNNAFGISVSARNGSSPVNIVNRGGITTTGKALSFGIRAFTYASNNPVNIVNSGDISAKGAINNVGILAYAFDKGSPIDIVNSGDISVEGGSSGGGIAALAPFSSIRIENSGSVFAQGTMLVAGIYAKSGTGTTIINSGDISSSSHLAIFVDGAGTAKIYNAGKIAGFVDLTEQNDLFVNQNGGVFEAKMTSLFGGGNDLFRNELGGTVQAATNASKNESSAFQRLETFQNQGLISTVDGGTGDSFTISNTPGGTDLNFVASGNSTVALDAFLGGPSNSSADTFTIEGNVSGVTTVEINNTNEGPGVFNPKGISVVFVTGATPNSNAFKLAQPIDTGFFNYDLFFTPTGSGYWSLKSSPGGGAYLLPQLVTAAQDIWHEGSSTWFDRTADLRVLVAGGPSPTAYDPGGKSLGPGGPDNLTPAVWARGSGSWLSHDDSASTSASGRTYNYNLDRDLETMDFQMGLDLGKRDVLSQGDALVFGVVGGFVQANLDYDNLVRQFDFNGGQVGAYATYLKGGLFVDTLFNAHLYELNPNATLGFPSSLSASTLGVRTDTGYRFGSFSGGAFLEPLATIEVMWANIDGFSLGGNTVSFGDSPDVRGRVGLRAGTTMEAWTGTLMEPFVIGSLWGNFSDNNTATLVSTGRTFHFQDNLNDAWGEFSGGVNFFNFSQTTSVFAKVDVTLGDNLTGVGGKAGMRVAW